VIIKNQSDFPDPTNGTITLENGVVYAADGFVTVDTPLELSGISPLIGRHGAADGFIFTGSGTMLQGDGAFMARDLYLHAPGETVFGLDADNTTEMLVESISLSDAAGLGNISSLGTISGYRVPSIKGCNFENFDSGLTFTGTSDKIFISSSPFRGVDASNVTILEFDENLDTGIIDMPNNYVKGVQSDTEVIRVDANASIGQIFQYRGTTHGSTVTKANILNGVAEKDKVGYQVTDSYPLADSVGVANYTLDSSSTVTISSQASDRFDASAYVTIPGATTPIVSKRFTHNNNEITYDGVRDANIDLHARISAGTATGDVIALAWFNNGSLVTGSATSVKTQGTGQAIETLLTSFGTDANVRNGDTYDVRVANLDSTNDIDVGELDGRLKGEF